jgi:hypothetical protein
LLYRGGRLAERRELAQAAIERVAHRHRPGPGRPSRPGHGRRADGEPGLGDWGVNPRAVARTA